MVHVQECIMSVFQSAWFGKKNAAALGRAKHGNLFAAQKQSLCCSDAKMAVYGECETIELIKWIIMGLYLICHHEAHQTAEGGYQDGLPVIPGAVF